MPTTFAFLLFTANGIKFPPKLHPISKTLAFSHGGGVMPRSVAQASSLYGDDWAKAIYL